MVYAQSVSNPPEMKAVSHRQYMLPAVALLALGASSARAQITTVLAPPVAKSQTVAAAPTTRARRDSVARARLTDMKAWVDSAAASAGVSGGTTTVVSTGDVSAGRGHDAPAAAAPATPAPVTSFHEGAPAPATASPLPLLALAGVTALVVGALLMRRRA
ncbi:MAG: hypothetical protein NVS9B3_00820 [Gemmatimonadaceae bacterium]